MKNICRILVGALVVMTIPSCSNDGAGSTAENDSIGLSAPAIEKNLATESTVTITLDSLNDFEGVIDLALDRSDLDDKFDANDDIVLSLSESNVTLIANETQDVTLTIEIKGSAPSFQSTDNNGDGKINIVATMPGGETLKINVPFQVNSIYESRLSVDPDTGVHTWDKPLVENFRAHEGDLKLIFINMDDLDEHRVHSTGGAFDHQDEDMVAATSPGEEGGKYEVIADQTGGDTSYYCHSHAAFDDVHVMTFNN